MKLLTFQDVLQTSTTAQAKLGEKAATPDGRRWVYAKANEALTKFHLAISAANTAVTNVTSSGTNNDGQIVYITKSAAGWTVGAFQNAWGVVNDDTAEGQVFKVKDNSATVLELFPEYALGTALDATSDIVLVTPLLVRKVLVTALLQQCQGFAQVAFASADYGWLLQDGIGGVLPGTVLVQDEYITPGDDTAGEVVGITNGETIDDVSLVGRCVVPNTTADKATLAQVFIV